MIRCCFRVLKGIIFDFDGVLLETEMPRYLSWKSIFHDFGFSLTIEQWQQGVGTGPTAFDPAALLHTLTGEKVKPEISQLTADQLALKLVKEQPTLPGVREFISAARDAGLKLAVASSSNRDWVVGNLERIGLYSLLEAVCTAEDVDLVKPDPALYLLALEQLSLSASDCVAFEDSTNGILAAKRAQLKCIAIPNPVTANMDFSGADKIVASFMDVNMQDLKTLIIE